MIKQPDDSLKEIYLTRVVLWDENKQHIVQVAGRILFDTPEQLLSKYTGDTTNKVIKLMTFACDSVKDLQKL